MEQNIDDVEDRVIPEGPEEAANWMDIDTDSSRESIQKRFRKLTLQYHPDRSGQKNTTDNFKRLQNARDMLVSNRGERKSERVAYSSRREEGQTTTESPFTSATDSTQYRATVEAIKLMMLEDATGQDLSEYEGLEDAVDDGEILLEQIERVNTRLQQKYGNPGLNLEMFAGVLATLIVSGAVDLGDVDRMAEEAGFFTPGGRRGSESGFFQSRGRGRNTDSFFQ